MTTEPRLELSRVLLELGTDGLSLGLVAIVGDETNYDPYWLYEEPTFYEQLGYLVWAQFSGATFSDDGVSLQLTYSAGISATLDIVE